MTGSVLSQDPSDWIGADALRRQAESRGDDPWVQIGRGPFTSFGSLYGGAVAVANGLRGLGVGSGDPVAAFLPISRPALECWFGTNLAGGYDIPLNVAYRGNPLVHALNLSRARVAIVAAEYLDRLAEIEDQLTELSTVVVVPTGEEANAHLRGLTTIPYGDLLTSPRASLPTLDHRALASVIFTSGTTGPAKGVMMPHAQCYFTGKGSVEGIRLSSEDTHYCIHPLFHLSGKFGATLATLLAGARIVIEHAFDPDQWLDRIRELGATTTIGHGPMLEVVYARDPRPDDTANPLRALYASPFPKAIAADFERRFGVRGIEVWGMTEVTTVTFESLDDSLDPGACGRPQNDFEVSIRDPETDEAVEDGSAGEICVRPRRPWITMSGYLGMPDETVAAWRNLWFHSGDIGYVDASGKLRFVERKGERIRRRGENISAYDIEVAANSHPAVVEAAAVGVPSGHEADDDILLCVVWAPDAVGDPAELLRHMVRQVPHFMMPRYVRAMDRLPRTSTTKVQKDTLRAEGVVGSWDRSAAGVSVRELLAQTES